MVPDRRPRRGGRGARPRPRGDGHPPLGLRHLGADAARPGRGDQGDRCGQRLLPPLHSAELLRRGGQARRGLRQGDGGGHPPPPGAGRGRLTPPGRRATRAPDRPPHLRDDHRPLLRQVDQLLPGPAPADQPVVQHRPLGAAPAGAAADDGVPLAGGSHRPRHRGGGARGDPADARRLPSLHRVAAGHPGDRR